MLTLFLAGLLKKLDGEHRGIKNGSHLRFANDMVLS